MDIASMLPYLVGALGMWAYQRWGGKSPIPVPVPPVPIPLPPGPAPAPTADREATKFLGWLIKVQSGVVRLDDQDKRTLTLIKTALAEVEGEKKT